MRRALLMLQATRVRAPERIHELIVDEPVELSFVSRVRELIREIEDGALEPGLAQRIFAPVAAMATRIPTHLGDVVLTFDSDVRFIERPRVGTALEDSIEGAVGPYLRYGDPTARALDRAELADIVRGVAADKWRDEREVREQLATLVDESARAFFEDAAERTRRRSSRHRTRSSRWRARASKA